MTTSGVHSTTCVTTSTTHGIQVQPLISGEAPPPALNWSHFKSELAVKSDEDAETPLLRTDDLLETHVFPKGAKVHRFCLNLVVEARLWYDSLRPITVDWNGFKLKQAAICQAGNTREHLFHAWM